MAEKMTDAEMKRLQECAYFVELINKLRDDGGCVSIYDAVPGNDPPFSIKASGSWTNPAWTDEEFSGNRLIEAMENALKAKGERLNVGAAGSDHG